MGRNRNNIFHIEQYVLKEVCFNGQILASDSWHIGYVAISFHRTKERHILCFENVIIYFLLYVIFCNTG